MSGILYRLILTVALMTSSLLLGACGQMGPLYLPTEEPAANETEDAAADAPEQEDEQQ